MTEDEMGGWHHQLNGHEFGWTQGVDVGQGGLACCSSWGLRSCPQSFMFCRVIKACMLLSHFSRV